MATDIYVYTYIYTDHSETHVSASHPQPPHHPESKAFDRARTTSGPSLAGPGASRGVQGSPGGVQGGSRGWFNNRYIQNFIFLNFGQVSGLPAPGRGRDPGAQTAVRAKHGSDCNGLGRERHHRAAPPLPDPLGHHIYMLYTSRGTVCIIPCRDRQYSMEPRPPAAARSSPSV